MLVRLATALDTSRVRPVVLCFREAGVWSQPLLDREIPVHENLLAHKYDFLVIRRLVQLLRRYQPACIMPVGSGGDRMFWSTLAAQIARSPVAVWSHLFPVPEQPEFEWVNRRLYPFVDTFVALGQRHADALAHAAGAPPRRICVIRNGIDVAAFDRPDLRGHARNLLDLRPDDVAIGMVANLRPIKRVGLFIEAAAQIHAARPAARFFVIGEGSQRPELERQMQRLGLSAQNFTLLGPREDVPLLTQAFDIACLTSHRECLSVAMLEAMAAAKPFVAPNVGSLDEALIDNQTGRFFSPPTPENLARTIIQLIDSPAERQRLGENARTKVRSEFRLDQMARAFETLVTDLCARTTG